MTAAGTATAGDTYTDRPTVVYSPLTGVDFLKRLMTPIPLSSVLFMLQSGYFADRIMPITSAATFRAAQAAKKAQTRRAIPMGG